MDRYVGATILGFDPHRWYANLRLQLADGTKETLVIDATVNAGDGIWWGSAEEYEEARDW